MVARGAARVGRTTRVAHRASAAMRPMPPALAWQPLGYARGATSEKMRTGVLCDVVTTHVDRAMCHVRAKSWPKSRKLLNRTRPHQAHACVVGAPVLLVWQQLVGGARTLAWRHRDAGATLLLGKYRCQSTRGSLLLRHRMVMSSTHSMCSHNQQRYPMAMIPSVAPLLSTV